MITIFLLSLLVLASLGLHMGCMINLKRPGITKFVIINQTRQNDLRCDSSAACKASLTYHKVEITRPICNSHHWLIHQGSLYRSKVKLLLLRLNKIN